MKRIRPLSAAIAILLVTALCQAKERWFEVRSAHFLVVTNAGEERGRDTALHLEHIRAFFRQSLAITGHHPIPFVTVLAVKDRDTMLDILGRSVLSNRQQHFAGMFVHPLDQHLAVVQLDTQRSGYYETFYHEYYHSITMPVFPDLPLWLAEGLAEFYGRTDIGEDSVSTGIPDRDLLDVLRQTRLIPLDILFHVDHKSPYYNEVNKVGIFYAESWLATHYLMIGNPEAHRRLVKYLDALSQGKSWTEAAVAFGDLKKLQGDLSAYVQQRKFLSVSAPLPRISVDDFKIRPLSEAEAEAYLGRASAELGHTQEALRTLTRATKRDPNCSLAYESLGMAQFLDGQTSKALESASESVRLNPNDTPARYLRAYYAMKGPATLATDVPIEEDLRQAIIQNPELSPAYALLGLYLAVRAQRSEEGLSLVKQAVSLDPSNYSYQLSLARVLYQMNRFDDAKAAVVRAEALARDQNERIQIQELGSLLDQQHRANQIPSPRSQ